MATKTVGTQNPHSRNSLGPCLRALRKHEGLSAEELAARIELQNEKYSITISANHLHKVERQQKPLSDNLLLAYLEALGASLQDFVNFYEEGQ
ncbi:helix-turn-helix domain-containing protein [Salinivibrio sp. VYel6]|jgi:Helix-turn-helix.|uniref:helix-turn-helix domain-containing protein n=1 Tax=Salinivibrio sp. VYel6 TaxID=2490493 RepID=UPI001561CE75|nr:helix-turn-helix transcriptional regulator [Salinivibrio sp. VYel6]